MFRKIIFSLFLVSMHATYSVPPVRKYVRPWNSTLGRIGAINLLKDKKRYHPLLTDLEIARLWYILAGRLHNVDTRHGLQLRISDTGLRSRMIEFLASKHIDTTRMSDEAIFNQCMQLNNVPNQIRPEDFEVDSEIQPEEDENDDDDADESQSDLNMPLPDPNLVENNASANASAASDDENSHSSVDNDVVESDESETKNDEDVPNAGDPLNNNACVNPAGQPASQNIQQPPVDPALHSNIIVPPAINGPGNVIVPNQNFSQQAQQLVASRNGRAFMVGLALVATLAVSHKIKNVLARKQMPEPTCWQDWIKILQGALTKDQRTQAIIHDYIISAFFDPEILKAPKFYDLMTDGQKIIVEQIIAAYKAAMELPSEPIETE